MIGFHAQSECILVLVLVVVLDWARFEDEDDDETAYLLDELAAWFAICGEAIHGTRPWRTQGEGVSDVLLQGFKEEKVAWNSSDIRYTFRAGQTARGKTLYAFLLSAPENRIAVLKSLAESEEVAAVKMLGAGACRFNQAFGVLTVQLPAELPTRYANVLALEMK